MADQQELFPQPQPQPQPEPEREQERPADVAGRAAQIAVAAAKRDHRETAPTDTHWRRKYSAKTRGEDLAAEQAPVFSLEPRRSPSAPGGPIWDAMRKNLNEPPPGPTI